MQSIAAGYMSIMGTRVIRTEDPRLLTAGGVYVDDLRTPELNRAAQRVWAAINAAQKKASNQ